VWCSWPAFLQVEHTDYASQCLTHLCSLELELINNAIISNLLLYQLLGTCDESFSTPVLEGSAFIWRFKLEFCIKVGTSLFLYVRIDVEHSWYDWEYPFYHNTLPYWVVVLPLHQEAHQSPWCHSLIDLFSSWHSMSLPFTIHSNNYIYAGKVWTGPCVTCWNGETNGYGRINVGGHLAVSIWST
jgi:hypothetical protein